MRYARDPSAHQCLKCGKSYTGYDNDPCPRCGGFGLGDDNDYGQRAGTPSKGQPGAKPVAAGGSAAHPSKHIPVGSRGVAKILVEPESASLKRIAWAFGCAKKDSEEEAALYRLLVERVAAVRAAREATS